MYLQCVPRRARDAQHGARYIRIAKRSSKVSRGASSRAEPEGRRDRPGPRLSRDRLWVAKRHRAHHRAERRQDRSRGRSWRPGVSSFSTFASSSTHTCRRARGTSRAGWRTRARQHGSMAAWQHGSMAAWQHGAGWPPLTLRRRGKRRDRQGGRQRDTQRDAQRDTQRDTQRDGHSQHNELLGEVGLSQRAPP